LDESFKLCYSCMTYMKVISYEESGQLSKRVINNCMVCSYDWNKERYYNQLTLDLENKVNKHGKWIVSPEDRHLERIERTLSYAYRELDEHTVNEVFYKALNHYWYKRMFTLVRSSQS
jgi:hypothetical protein